MQPARFTAPSSRQSTRTFAALLLSAFPLLATAQTWTNPATGDWSTGSNWSSGLEPGSTDAVTLDAGTAVISGQNASASSVTFGQTVSGSTAALTINGAGTLASNSAGLGYTAGTTATATLTGTGSQWTIGTYLTVGRAGNGTLQVAEGAALSTGADTVIAENAASESIVTVSEEGSQWNASGSVYVGDHGIGRLRIYQGATATFTGSTSVARQTDGTGIVTIAEVGTTWNTQGLLVGHRGTANLYVTDEATLTNTGAAQLGVVAGSSGTADLDRGGRWTNTGELTVGLFGDGALYLNNASELTATASTLGADTVAIGSVTLEGGSSWTNSEELVVGMSGGGYLAIYEGSSVSNTDGVIGYYALSTGHVEVAGENSLWTNTDSLYVGLAGTAVLKIYDQGRVTVGGDSLVSLGYLGEIRIGDGGTAGTLDATTVTANSGGKIIFEHTEAAYEFSTDITGTVSIAQIGTGRTILSGANTFSGYTTISDGTLAAGAANVLSANSALFINNGATLDLAGYDQTVGDLDSYNFSTGDNDSGIVILGGATLTNRNRVTNNWAGSLTGAGTLVKQGETTMNWYGANTFTGLLQIDAGTLNARTANTLSAHAVVHVASPATLALQDSQTIAGLSGSGLVSLGGSTLTLAQASDTTFSGNISGGGDTVKTGAGTLTLAGENTYTGGTTISAGTLRIGHVSALGAGPLTLAGGTLDLNGFNLTLADPLTLTAASVIDFSGGVTLRFGDSSEVNWTGTLTLVNFDPEAAALFFGTDALGLTESQLNLIEVEGYTITGLSETGQLTLEATAVPEPASTAAALAFVALAGALWRRPRQNRAAHR